MITRLITPFACLALLAASSGCVVVDGDPQPSPAYGTLTASWTLDGSAGPSICTYYAIDHVDVLVLEDDGWPAADAAPYCEDFGVSFDLPAGWYSTEVTLVDFHGIAVSDTIVVDVQVLRDAEVRVEIDFPDSSIF